MKYLKALLVAVIAIGTFSSAMAQDHHHRHHRRHHHIHHDQR